MPRITLVVCLRAEKTLLQRLLGHADGCYDDLVVVHDGPELSSTSGSHNRKKGTPEALSLDAPGAPPLGIARDYSALKTKSPVPQGYRLKIGKPTTGSIHALVQSWGGRFYEGPRCFQQEPHWPFAWWAAHHDWILRLDADEYPSRELARWIADFRKKKRGTAQAAAFTCLWPLWDGVKSCTHHWPRGRLFLFRKSKVRFWGMVEQAPLPDSVPQPIHLKLIHAPNRKSYGIRNILCRQQAYIWRKVIADSVTGSADKVPRWRTGTGTWPEPWRSKLVHPLWKAWFCLFWFPFCQAKDMWREERKLDLSACLNPGLHHFLMQIEIIRFKYRSSQ